MVLKVGMKTWSGNKISQIRKSASIGDFTEVTIEPDKDFIRLKKIKTKWVIHCGHAAFGFNPADKNIWKHSHYVLNKAIEGADFLKADKIIVHPGYLEMKGSKGNMKNAIEFLKQYKDKRILLENQSWVYNNSRFKTLLEKMIMSYILF